jgi:Pretoxin HINT domain
MRVCAFLWCRGSGAFRGQSAALLLAVLSLAVPAGVVGAKNQDRATTTANQLLDAAGRAKADGQSGQAFALLHEAVKLAPENSVARWQLGQVKVGKDWLSVEEAQRRADADPRQAKYRERKDSLGDTPQEQLAMARWCRGNDLVEEAQFYWASVLAVDPSNKEALRAVGMRWHAGELKSPAQIREEKEAASKTKQSNRQWAVKVAAWSRDLSEKESKRDGVLEEIGAVDDVAAIPAFEKVTLDASLRPDSKNQVARQLSLAFIAALKNIREVAGTHSLARHAVVSRYADVRTNAIYELRDRPLQDFVPTLLDNLASALRSSYRVVNDPDGSVHYMHALYREGPFADWAYRRERSIFQPGSGLGMMANMVTPASLSTQTTTNVNTGSRGVSSAGAARSARQYEQEIVEGERKVAETNLQAAMRNERIVAVLNGVTEQSLGSEPRAWWDWWQDYTDYYRTAERPVYSEIDRSNDYIIPPVQIGGSSGSVECFAAGTPVWTKTGQRPIERLQMGDLVLAQNVDTGEIRYKPVLARTLRPAGPTLEVSTGDEKFQSTRGHPLWVAGVGWRMAKELEKGAVLNSLSGTGRIQAIQSAPEVETYNLVVADFNTYFIGSSGILAHDNTPRRPTQAVVPGLPRTK